MTDYCEGFGCVLSGAREDVPRARRPETALLLGVLHGRSCLVLAGEPVAQESMPKTCFHACVLGRWPPSRETFYAAEGPRPEEVGERTLLGLPVLKGSIFGVALLYQGPSKHLKTIKQYRLSHTKTIKNHCFAL